MTSICAGLAFIMMTVIRVDNLEAYFHQGDYPLDIRPTINFSKYMSIHRFKQINEMHVFVKPDAQR